ncbi:riboflavin synthase [Peptoniphilus stercorisuis]|uniref:Riboflavin synthase n=1 Tax=Peptoniphilus stercorisuis TaxID=1436965 RepID=A0ABS4KB95_9FIRM|nr:riboflavin synthase [Peptoniphilus stercorisuis]MBP2025037.1 riboflavin synthase [Peptoniphilus stercorisuis]
MFTGIVEEVGIIKNIKKNSNSLSLTISANKVLEDIKLGDSICTNGVCLTVTDFDKYSFTVDAIESTIRKTDLYNLDISSKVNLERALSLKDRLGGHIVQGHVDGIGEIANIRDEDLSKVYSIKAKENLLNKLVKQGSITISGVSLTISDLKEDYFEVSIIPHTLKETIINDLKIGDIVNLEIDIIGKYIDRFLNGDKSKDEKVSSLSLDFLAENGF